MQLEYPQTYGSLFYPPRAPQHPYNECVYTNSADAEEMESQLERYLTRIGIPRACNYFKTLEGEEKALYQAVMSALFSLLVQPKETAQLQHADCKH